MSKAEKIQTFERKLRFLKEEESLILKILKDVRKQLRKYEVEELHTCSESMVVNSDGEDNDTDEVVCGDKKSLLQALDCAELVNNRSLNLELNKALEEGSNEEDEDSNQSD